jgi:hypothetical protein
VDGIAGACLCLYMHDCDGGEAAVWLLSRGDLVSLLFEIGVCLEFLGM